MAYKFIVKQIINGFTHINGEYKQAILSQKFECNTFDDLSDCILSLVDYSTETVRLEIEKKEVKDKWQKD